MQPLKYFEPKASVLPKEPLYEINLNVESINTDLLALTGLTQAQLDLVSQYNHVRQHILDSGREVAVLDSEFVGYVKKKDFEAVAKQVNRLREKEGLEKS